MRVMLDTNVIFSLALFGGRTIAAADVLVTGDKDFGDVDVDRPEILTPVEYVEEYVGS